MTKVSLEMRELVEDVFRKSTLEIGVIITHQKTGKLVKITNGSYWGTYGISNFWYWREVLPGGTLSEKEECGYGHEFDAKPAQLEIINKEKVCESGINILRITAVFIDKKYFVDIAVDEETYKMPEDRILNFYNNQVIAEFEKMIEEDRLAQIL